MGGGVGWGGGGLLRGKDSISFSFNIGEYILK